LRIDDCAWMGKEECLSVSTCILTLLRSVAHLAHIAKHNPALNTIVTIDAEGARQRTSVGAGSE
jgi:hypothetical protein